MYKIFMLAFANIKKTKNQAVSLCVMFIISALLLNIGMLIFIDYGGYFNKLVNELNTADTFITIPFSFYDDTVDDYIKNHENVTETDRTELIPVDYTVIRENKNDFNATIAIYNAEQEKTLTKWKYIGKHEPITDDMIYIADYFNISFGYKTGDKITFMFDDYEREFIIGGFIENLISGSPDVGFYSAYISEKAFNDLSEKVNDIKAWHYYLNLKETNTSAETDITDYVYKNVDSDSIESFNFSKSTITFNLAIVKMARTMMASIISAILIAFSFIIVIICLIVVRFRINNSINEDITKLGSLSAAGYTSRQIISSVAIQFITISIIGSIAGIVCSYPLIPVASSVLSAQSGLSWEQGLNGTISGISLFFMVIITALISFISAKKIKKLNPITALRGGITTHSFKKNHLPLDKARGSLSFIMAGKTIMNSFKQNVMIAVIIISVSFGAGFSFVMFYNTLIDTKTFAETPGYEVSNIEITFDLNKISGDDFCNEILNRDDVRKVIYLDSTTLTIKDTLFYTHICGDYNEKETHKIYEGRYPLHDNEVSIGGVVAESIGLKIGDTVTIEGYEYIICGLQQGAQFGGKNASITLEGYKRMHPDFMFSKICIYLEKGADTEAVLNNMSSEHADVILKTWNIDEEIENGMNSYIGIVSMVGIAVMAVMFMITILVLYFVINSTIIRKKHELGIQKAIGFTTFELMNQMSLSFLPAITVGSVLGSILSIYTTNPIMSIAMRGMGVVKANFIIIPFYILLIGLLIVVISYITSLFITAKIRKISAYALITE